MGQPGLVTVGGKLNIGTATVQVAAAPGTYSRNTRYLIMSATGGVSGQFSNAFTDMAFLKPVLTYSGNSVLLNLINTNIPFASVATTPNQKSVAAGFDAGSHTGAVYNAVLLETDAGARQGFDALSGEVYATAATVQLDQSQYMRDAVLDRMRQGDAAAAVAGPASGELASGGLHLTVWGEALGASSRSTFQNTGGIAGHSYTSGGVVGLDGLFHSWRAGIAAAQTITDFDVDGRASRVSVDSTHLALYAAGPVIGSVKLRAGLDYAWSSLSANRTVAFPGFNEQDSAHYHSDTADLFAETAYPLLYGPVAIEPYASITHVQVDTDGFTENGGASALRAGSTRPDDTFSELGLRAASAVRLGGSVLSPYLTLGWRHASATVRPPLPSC